MFLAKNGLTGFVITESGDLQGVFSVDHRGIEAMNLAIKQGATTLDCFDVGLPGFYNRFGFKEYKREKNWTPGGPDVVYMKRS